MKYLNYDNYIMMTGNNGSFRLTGFIIKWTVAFFLFSLALPYLLIYWPLKAAYRRYRPGGAYKASKMRHPESKVVLATIDIQLTSKNSEALDKFVDSFEK